MKTIFLSGRLTADPEISIVGKDSRKVANFTVANNDSGKEGGEFFDVRCWEQLADFVEGYLRKGNRIILQGTCNQESYKDADGKGRNRFSITASRIEFAGR